MSEHTDGRATRNARVYARNDEAAGGRARRKESNEMARGRIARRLWYITPIN